MPRVTRLGIFSLCVWTLGPDICHLHLIASHHFKFRVQIINCTIKTTRIKTNCHMVQLHFEKDFRPRIHLLSNFTLFTAFFFLAYPDCYVALGLLLLSRFSRVLLCATPETAAHQAPPSLGFSRQEHWSGLPFPSPMHESEK